MAPAPRPPRPDLSGQRRSFGDRPGSERAAGAGPIAIRTALDAALTQRRAPGTDRVDTGSPAVAPPALRSVLAARLASRKDAAR